MGSILSGCIENPIDNEFTNEMQMIIDEHIALIPLQYLAEREHIVNEMRRVSPQPYQSLFFADYPTKNGPQVNALARKNVTTDQVKDQIAHQVNARLEPKIQSMIANKNPLVRWIILHAIEKAIETAVSRAVDTVVVNHSNTPTTATTKP